MRSTDKNEGRPHTSTHQHTTQVLRGSGAQTPQFTLKNNQMEFFFYGFLLKGSLRYLLKKWCRETDHDAEVNTLQLFNSQTLHFLHGKFA